MLKKIKIDLFLIFLFMFKKYIECTQFLNGKKNETADYIICRNMLINIF